MESSPSAQPAGAASAWPALSVLLSTRDRAGHLANLLGSLEGEWGDIEDAVVVDNGSRDGTRALLVQRATAQPKLVPLHVAQPGKARALNVALARARGELCAFLDDDVIVQPGWARALRRAASQLDAPVFQGRVRLPPEARADPLRLALLARYGTLPLVDPPAPTATWHTLVGANMAIRRGVLARVGGFDERLGPGAAGLSEDTDLWNRIARETGGRIAFVGDAEVHHVLEDERMCDAFHELWHRRLGRSRYHQKSPSLLGSIAPNLAGAWLRWQIARRCASERKAYRERGRLFAYREMLAAWREERG